MVWDRESAVKDITAEAEGLIKRAEDLEYGDDKAFLRDVLYELEKSFISIVRVGNPGESEPPEGDVDPVLIATFTDRVSKLNYVVDRASSLVNRVVSAPAKVLMDVIRNWVTRTLTTIMPHITRFLKLQSWSFGISAAGFATITFTFGG